MDLILIIWNWITSNWELSLTVFAALYELIVRKTPTAQDYSFINLFKKIIDALLSNRKKTGGIH